MTLALKAGVFQVLRTIASACEKTAVSEVALRPALAISRDRGILLILQSLGDLPGTEASSIVGVFV